MLGVVIVDTYLQIYERLSLIPEKKLDNVLKMCYTKYNESCAD